MARAARARRLLLRSLAAYGMAEALFQAYRWTRIKQAAQHPPERGDAAAAEKAMEQAMDRFFQLKGVIDIRAFFTGWFRGTAFEDIRRDNVHEFVVASVLCVSEADVLPRQSAAVDAFIDRIEADWGIKFLPGRNPAAVAMTHLWEPLRLLPVPLVVFLASEACGLVGRIMLLRLGFTRINFGGFAFWVRSQSAVSSSAACGCSAGGTAAANCHGDGSTGSGSSSIASGGSGAGGSTAAAAVHGSGTGGNAAAEVARKRPLVFLHGVGWGLFPYLRFVSRLVAAAPGHPVIAAEVRHISLRLTSLAQPVDGLAHAVAAVLRLHDFRDATFVGHSYGTFAVSRIRQLYPQAVHSMALLDPVCLMTCSPHLLANFIYRRPALPAGRFFAPGWLDVLDVLRYMCARDLTIASAFCRGFYWSELQLWPQDMPGGSTDGVGGGGGSSSSISSSGIAISSERSSSIGGGSSNRSNGSRTLVSMSGCDTLVPVEDITRQLEAAGSKARVMLQPWGGHGGFLFDGAYQGAIVEEIRRLVMLAPCGGDFVDDGAKTHNYELEP